MNEALFNKNNLEASEIFPIYDVFASRAIDYESDKKFLNKNQSPSTPRKLVFINI